MVLARAYDQNANIASAIDNSWFLRIPEIPSKVIDASILMQYTCNESLIWWVWHIQKKNVN